MEDDKKTRRIVSASLLALMAAVAAGCGGGGTDAPASAGAGASPAPAPTAAPGPAPAPAIGVAGTAEGLWKDDTQPSGDTRYLLVEADGRLWGIPAVQRFLPGATPTEAIKANITVTSGTVAGTFSEVALTGCAPPFTCNVSGVSTPSQLTLSGTKSALGATLPGWTFPGKPEASYQVAANVTQLAGTWNMGALIPGNFFAQGALQIGATGTLTATNIGGCAFTGALVPVTGKGYLRVTLSAVGGTCASGVVPSQVTGVAFQASPAGQPATLHFMWHGADVTKFLWSSGVR